MKNQFFTSCEEGNPYPIDEFTIKVGGQKEPEKDVGIVCHGDYIDIVYGPVEDTKIDQFTDMPSALRRMAEIIEEIEMQEKN